MSGVSESAIERDQLPRAWWQAVKGLYYVLAMIGLVAFLLFAAMYFDSLLVSK